MTRITVDLNVLRNLLTASLPFAGEEYSMPTINAVDLQGKGKWLVATATDRYIVGMTRTAVEGVDGFAALIKVADAKHILRTLAAAKGQAAAVTVSLVVNDGRLTIEREDGLFAVAKKAAPVKKAAAKKRVPTQAAA